MLQDAEGRNIEYWPPGPVSADFLKSKAFICGLKGPIGSGKSVTCVMKLLRNAAMQPLSSDGFRHSRYAITRNTAPELKSTTMVTWHQWVPKHLGNWVSQGPPTHHIIDPVNKLNMEVIFVPLDSPEDVKKVLSMDLTAAWMNEAREMPKAILDGLSGRVGRFKPDINQADIWPVDPMVLMDTNPPDTDHWWHALDTKDTSTPFGRQMLQSMEESENELRAVGLLAPGQRLFEFFNQPGAYEHGAENLQNVIPGYYARAKAGKTQNWITVYVDGKYGFVQDGKPVFPEYRQQVHCREFNLIPGLPIAVGLDFGMTPAAVFAQYTPEGQWRIHSEIIGEGMNIFKFAAAIKAQCAQLYTGYRITKLTGDPAGNNRNSADKESRTNFQILASLKVHAQPAPGGNVIPTRLAAVQYPLSRMINGEPGIIVHPQCRFLNKGLAGGYRYKRVKVTGDERYKDEPDKNVYSHVADALQYLLLGGGEYERIIDAGNNQVGREQFDDYTPAVDGVI
jgi:hypothetical protein